MRLGIALPHYDFALPGHDPVRPGDAVAWARRCEALGFDSVWISDHLLFSLARYGSDDRLQGALEPLTTLAAIATATERVRIGTLVLGAPFRPPAMLRAAAATLARLAPGRVDLGLGAGWYEDEFRRFGMEFGTLGDRFASLEAALAALGPLRTGPSEDRVRVWVGGKGGDRGLGLVARHADGWNTVWRWTPEDLGARIARLREICDREGRDPATLAVSVGLYALVGEDAADLDRRRDAMRSWRPEVTGDDWPDAWRRDALAGTADEVAARIGDYAEIGVDEVIVAPATLPFAIPDADMVDLIARSVLPRVR